MLPRNDFLIFIIFIFFITSAVKIILFLFFSEIRRYCEVKGTASKWKTTRDKSTG